MRTWDQSFLYHENRFSFTECFEVKQDLLLQERQSLKSEPASLGRKGKSSSSHTMYTLKRHKTATQLRSDTPESPSPHRNPSRSDSCAPPAFNKTNFTRHIDLMQNRHGTSWNKIVLEAFQRIRGSPLFYLQLFRSQSLLVNKQTNGRWKASNKPLAKFCSGANLRTWGEQGTLQSVAESRLISAFKLY